MKKGIKRRTLKDVLKVILIGFAIVAFWRGAWHLMDELLFPNDYLLSAIVSIIIGVAILYFTKNLIRELV